MMRMRGSGVGARVRHFLHLRGKSLWKKLEMEVENGMIE